MILYKNDTSTLYNIVLTILSNINKISIFLDFNLALNFILN